MAESESTDTSEQTSDVHTRHIQSHHRTGDMIEGIGVLRSTRTSASGMMTRTQHMHRRAQRPKSCTYQRAPLGTSRQVEHHSLQKALLRLLETHLLTSHTQPCNMPACRRRAAVLKQAAGSSPTLAHSCWAGQACPGHPSPHPEPLVAVELEFDAPKCVAAVVVALEQARPMEMTGPEVPGPSAHL
jgi:hypothetical protein